MPAEQLFHWREGGTAPVQVCQRSPDFPSNEVRKMSRWVVYIWRRAHVFHQRNVGFIPAIAEDLTKEIVVSLGLHPIIRQ